MSSNRHFWYLATPYSKYEAGLEAAFEEACRCAYALIRAGFPCYSPIAQTHSIALSSGHDPRDHSTWLTQDEPMMHCARGLIVVKMPRWNESYGIGQEIEDFSQMGKPIIMAEWPLSVEDLAPVLRAFHD